MKSLVWLMAIASMLTALAGTAVAGRRCCHYTACVAACTHATHASKDIVDTAVAAGKFKTLAAALKAAGLIDTLKGEGPFTVFARQTRPLASYRRARSRTC